METLLFIFLVFLGLLAADLTTACVHFVVDNYASRDWPFVGRHYVAYAHDHHDNPLELLALSFVQCHWFILSFTAVMAVALFLVGGLNTLTISALVFGGATNFIHGFSHKTPVQNWALINFCHKIGLLQSPKNHEHHHNNESSHYALLTDYLNPLLEASRIFPLAERILAQLGLRAYWWEKVEVAG